MRVTGWLRRNPLEAAWAAFAVANFVAMVAWPDWETIPFHFVWISLTFVYGVRVWSTRTTWAVLSVVILATGVSIMSDAFSGIQLWGELFEVPLMAAMFLAMVWHAQRRQSALAEVQGVAEMRASLLDRQERFLHDASHELRTPVTIARGHLELLRRERPETPELEVALDELGRIERIVERLLLLAKSEQQGLGFEEIDVEAFLSTSSSAGRRSHPARGGSTSTSPGECSLTRKHCGTRLTRCSRTRSSTPTPATSSNSPRTQTEWAESSSRSQTRVSAFHPTRCPASSIVGPAPTAHARGSAAVRDSALRSSSQLRALTAATALSSRCRAGRLSGSTCPCGSPRKARRD